MVPEPGIYLGRLEIASLHGRHSRRWASVAAVGAASILSFLLPLAAEGELFPTEREFGLELVWKESLGSGHSGITVVDGRAVTMFSDGEIDNLVALDTRNGAELWRYPIASTFQGRAGSEDGPHSTPVIEDGVVYGLGPKGQLFAVSVADGKVIWTKRIDDEAGVREPYWGFATTPVIEAGVVVVQTGGENGRFVSGFDKKTGELLWSVGDDEVGYQSPAALTLVGQRQVVSVGNTVMMGIVPESGKVLWKYDYESRNQEGTTQPVLLDDDRILLRLMGSSAFVRNGAVLYQLQKSGNTFAIEEVWRTNAIKHNYALPVLHGGYLYGFNASFLNCVDPASGKELWKSRPPGRGSLTLADGHLVIIADRGVVVVEPSPEGYKEKARLPVFDRGSFTLPTVAEDQIFVRNQRQIASLRVTEARPLATRLEASRRRLDESEFADFVRRVEAAENKTAVLDEFMSSQQQFPILEGDSLVHFVYRGKVKDIAVAVSMMEVHEPMTRIEGTDFYYSSHVLAPRTRWYYQFHIDLDQFVIDPRNPRRTPSPWGQASELLMPGWASPKHLEEPTGDRGTVESFTVNSSILGYEREVAVYLPSAYDQGNERYPLLIVNNGIGALRFGKMDHTLDNLMESSIAPVIVAFVEQLSWPIMVQEYGVLTGDYARMLAEELVPHLEAKYRTQQGPQATAIMGTQLGGQVAVYTALSHPEVFGKVAVQSLRLLSPEGDELLSMIRGPKRPVQFHLGWDRYDARSVEYVVMDLRRDSRKLAALLEGQGYAWTGGETAEGAAPWGSRTDRILKAFFPLRPGN